MSNPQRLILCFLFCLPTSALAQQGAVSPAQAPAAAPALAASRINLDVLVTDKARKPVGELEPSDFTLLDNDQPRKILGFRRTDGVAGSKVDPPVEVIIVLDAFNVPYQAVTLQRLELDKFLRSNDGHLAQPVSIFVFSSDGLRVQPAPSRDGNALAAALDHVGPVRAMDSASGVFGEVERLNTSVQTMQGIAENEARKPGRKMVIWIGSGWPWLEANAFVKSNEARRSYFRSIVQLSTRLREARITLYALYARIAISSIAYQAYMKPITEAKKADSGNLGLQVLAAQSGGRVLDGSNDLSGQVIDCISDIGPYYTLSFAQPPAAQADEYHALKVQVSQPGLTARTNTGYYNQP